MHRFYTQQILTPHSQITLEEGDSHHLAKVLRLEAGNTIEVFNGEGSIAKAAIVTVHAKRSIVEIQSVEIVEKRSRVHVAFAISKSQALDFILHRCTEVGTTAFTPLTSQHSLHPNHWNEERWKKVVIEVCKQCQSAHVPKLNPPEPLLSFVEKRKNEMVFLFCDEAMRDAAPPFIPEGKEVVLLVGAEGGWSTEEREKILALGGMSFSLGANRLRAETAALVSLVLAKRLVQEV